MGDDGKDLRWPKQSTGILSFDCMNVGVDSGFAVALLCSHFPCVHAWECGGTNSCFFIHFTPELIFFSNGRGERL